MMMILTPKNMNSKFSSLFLSKKCYGLTKLKNGKIWHMNKVVMIDKKHT